MNTLGRILLVEDDPKDVELTLTALDEYHLANEVVVTSDGEQALDYLYYRGKYAQRTREILRFSYLTSNCRRSMGSKS